MEWGREREAEGRGVVEEERWRREVEWGRKKWRGEGLLKRSDGGEGVEGRSENNKQPLE